MACAEDFCNTHNNSLEDPLESRFRKTYLAFSEFIKTQHRSSCSILQFDSVTYDKFKVELIDYYGIEDLKAHILKSNSDTFPFLPWFTDEFSKRNAQLSKLD
jgi:hypothetical protein